MEEQQTYQEQPKKSLGRKILNGVGIATVATAKSALQNIQGLRQHMYNRQMQLKGNKKNQRPLKNEEYGIVMSDKNKHKLGLKMKW